MNWEEKGTQGKMEMRGGGSGKMLLENKSQCWVIKHLLLSALLGVGRTVLALKLSPDSVSGPVWCIKPTFAQLWI